LHIELPALEDLDFCDLKSSAFSSNNPSNIAPAKTWNPLINNKHVEFVDFCVCFLSLTFILLN